MKAFNILIYIFLGTALVFGIMLRSVDLLSGNYLFGFDQGRDYLAVKKIVVDHKPTLIGSEIGAGAAGFRGIFQGPFHYYFLSIPFLLSGGNPYGGIILMFLYGILTIILGYLLGKELFGKLGGLLVAALISLSPPFISQSRFVWNSHGAPVFILLAFYCAHKLSHAKNNKYIFGASFFSAFIYNFQFAIAVPMSIGLLVYLTLILKIRSFKKYLVVFSGFVLALLPMVLFEIKHNFMAIRGFLDYSSNPDKTEITLMFIKLLLRDHLGSFIFNVFDSFPKQNFASGEFIAIFLLACTLFFIVKEKDKDKKSFIIYLLSLPFVTFLILGFLRNAVYSYYLLHLSLVYVVLLVYILISSIQAKKVLPQIIVLIFISISFPQAFPNIIKTFVYDYKDYGGTAKIAGKKNAMDYIYKDAGKKEFNLLIFSPPVYIYPYDYLLWWYGSKKYGFVPGNKKEGTFYLLMEPDSSKPWSHKGWLETVIKEGEVVWEKKLPSGFIIQKRINE